MPSGQIAPHDSQKHKCQKRQIDLKNGCAVHKLRSTNTEPPHAELAPVPPPLVLHLIQHAGYVVVAVVASFIEQYQQRLCPCLLNTSFTSNMLLSYFSRAISLSCTYLSGRPKESLRF